MIDIRLAALALACSAFWGRIAQRRYSAPPNAEPGSRSRASNGDCLLRKFVAILLCPIAIRCDCLQRWSALCTTRTRAFHLCFRHARTRPVAETRTHVDDLLRRIFFMMFARRRRVCRSKCKAKQQCEKARYPNSTLHDDDLPIGLAGIQGWHSGWHAHNIHFAPSGIAIIGRNSLSR